MYKISIWLKGGGKIVEECDVNENEIDDLPQNIIDIIENKKENGNIEEYQGNVKRYIKR